MSSNNKLYIRPPAKHGLEDHQGDEKDNDQQEENIP